MKKTIFLSCLIIIAFAAFMLLHNSHSTANGYRIALLEPACHPAMDEISQGFIDTMNKQGAKKYTFTRYNANGNPTLLRSQAEEILHQKYDLAMTIGTNATQTLHELTTKKNIIIPVVFTAISDPVKNGIVASLDSSKNHVTGVQDAPNYDQQLNALLKINPNIHTMLLVYDPVSKGGSNEADARSIKTLLDKRNIHLNCVQVFHPNEITAKVQQLLPSNDVVMILTDHTTVSGVDSLVTLCNRYHVTLFASDLNSGDKGAALAYGVTEYDYGVQAAQQALLILDKQHRPSDIPVVMVKNSTLKINTKTMHKQGLSLSPSCLADVKKSGGIVI